MTISVHFNRGSLPGLTLASDLEHHGSAVLFVALLDVLIFGWSGVFGECKCDCVRLGGMPALSWQSVRESRTSDLVTTLLRFKYTWSKR